MACLLAATTTTTADDYGDNCPICCRYVRPECVAALLERIPAGELDKRGADNWFPLWHACVGSVARQTFSLDSARAGSCFTVLEPLAVGWFLADTTKRVVFPLFIVVCAAAALALAVIAAAAAVVVVIVVVVVVNVLPVTLCVEGRRPARFRVLEPLRCCRWYGCC
jgi:hypothetical protein